MITIRNIQRSAGGRWSRYSRGRGRFLRISSKSDNSNFLPEVGVSDCSVIKDNTNDFRYLHTPVFLVEYTFKGSLFLSTIKQIVTI